MCTLFQETLHQFMATIMDFYSLLNPVETDAPPSRVMVAPLTYAPAREDKKSAVPATSSGVPMRRDGFEATMTSPTVASVCAITKI